MARNGFPGRDLRDLTHLAMDPRARLDTEERQRCKHWPVSYVLTAQLPDDAAGVIWGGRQPRNIVLRETDETQFVRRVQQILTARRRRQMGAAA